LSINEDVSTGCFVIVLVALFDLNALRKIVCRTFRWQIY